VLDALALQTVAVDKGRIAATLPCRSWIGRVASYAKAVLAREVIALMAHGTEVRSSTLVPLLARESARGPATIRSPVRKIPPPPSARTRRRLAAGHRAQMHLSHQLRDAGGRRALRPCARLVLEAVLRASREHDGDCLRSAQSSRTASSYTWAERSPSSLRSGWRGAAERCCCLE
jgi:hypothetical protein